MIKFKKGDATKPKGNGVKIITHVCNDVGGWGSGFVVALSGRFGSGIGSPESMYRTWHRTKETYCPLREEFIQFGLGQTQFVQINPFLIIANMIAQENTISGNPGGGPPIRYPALELALSKVGDYVDTKAPNSGTVHMPRIGCGLAGGSWERVGPIVEDVLEGVNVTVYDL